MIHQQDAIIIPKSSPLRREIKIETVKQSRQSHHVSIPGFIEADPKSTIHVLSPLTGHLTKIAVNLGQKVKQNQILFIIESPDLAQAYTDDKKARALLVLTKNALTRATQVNRSGGNSVKDVQQAENDFLQASAEAKRTQKRLAIFGQNHFGRLIIRAPTEGYITEINYGLGTYITDPTSSILSIQDTSIIWVTAQVPEELTSLIKKDLNVGIQMPAYPGHQLKGKITFMSSFLDPDTRRNNTRIRLENPDNMLQPNMYATIDIALAEQDVIMIPISSILMNDDTTSVYVEDAPWHFKRKRVELGSEDKGRVRILSGLVPGDRVVIEGGIFIND
jgi:cobalt-zinc-cadmium efflux system membrane fusion protein